MSKHTQGPWTAHPDIGEDTRGMGWIRTPDGRDVSCYGTQELWMSENIANGKLMAAAPEMLAILDELEGAFDKEIYPEQKKEDFDALDDREYTVTITAKQWRALGRALGKAQGAA